MYHFNLGVISFYMDDIKIAINHFIRVEKINIEYDVIGRLFLLKCHYLTDKEYDERTIRRFMSDERYFVRTIKEIDDTNRKRYKNFVRILINIYNTRHGAGRMTKEKVERKLERLEFVYDKEWLLKQIEALR